MSFPHSESDEEEVDDLELGKRLMALSPNRSRHDDVNKEYFRPKDEWVFGIPEVDILPGETKEDVRRRFREWMPACVDDDSFNFVFYEKFWPDFKKDKVPILFPNRTSFLCTPEPANGSTSKRRGVATAHEKAL